MNKLLSIVSVFFILTGCDDHHLSDEKIALEKLKRENTLLEQQNKELQSFRDRYNRVKLSLYDELIEINKSFAPDDSKKRASNYLFIPKDIKSRLDSLSKEQNGEQKRSGLSREKKG